MSLILEALKKSEQQRRLGEAPTLGSPVVSTRRRRSLLPVLAILILAAAAAGWWLLRPSRAPAPPAAPTPITAQNPNPPAATAPKPGVRAPVAIMDVNRARQDRLQAGEAARQNVLRGQQERRAAELGGATRATPPAASSATSAAGSAGASMPAPSVPQKPADADTAAPPPTTPAQESVAAQPAPTLSGNAAQPTSTPTKDQPPAAGAAVPTIWDLPYATRKDIPVIDLSMHVYSADPKQRFVVIKGDRHIEGDEVGQDLVLKEIRPDGLVLDYKGQRFFFPRSGR